MKTVDWCAAASQHLYENPRQKGDPETITLMAVALYWARSPGTEWETGKATKHSQRSAAELLHLHRNSVQAAIQFWVARGFMEIVQRRHDNSLVIDLVVPAPPLVKPRREDFADSESWLDAVDAYMEKWKAAA